MSQTYYALLTAVGEAKLANAAALGTQLQISRMAVGDGNGVLPTPTREQTALVAEKYRAGLNELKPDPVNASQIIAELVIPETTGGFWIREMGLYDEAGDLIAVSNCPPSYKPQMAEGSGRTQVLRMVLIVSSTSAVQLKIDPSVVLATREFVVTTVAAELAKLDSKQSVRVATTAAIVLSGLQTIDGVSVAVGNRVLVKNQVAAATNGIYVVAAGAWSRAADADSAAKVTPGLQVAVEQGAANADTIWMLTTDGAITLGTTPLNFVNLTRGLAPLAAANSWPESQAFQKDITVAGLAELSNGTEDSPDLVWKTPLWKVFADIAAGVWRMFYEKDGTTKFPLMIDLAAERLLSFGREVWTAANFDPASKLDATARAADSARLEGHAAWEFWTDATARNRLSAVNTGEIGSYAFLSNGSGVNYLPGDIAPATGLRYSSHTSTTVAVAVVGSWRCMGWGNNGASSVYMRVA